MVEGLFQPMHLLVILVVALFFSVRASCRNWAKESGKVSATSRVA